MAETIKGKVIAKANKGVKLEGSEVWYSAFKPEMISGINKDDVVEITYTKKGIFHNLSKIIKVEAPKVEAPTTTGYKCEVCGVDLKDGKYKKCFTCNKAAKDNPPVEAKTETTSPEVEKKKEWTSKSNYGSAEDIAGKEIGCSAAAAAAAVTGISNNPEEILEAWRMLFNGILEHIRANK